MGLTKIQQTIAQRLRDGISIRAIAAEVAVHKRTVLLAKEKIKPNITFIKKAMFTQLKFLNFGSVVLSSAYEFFFASDSTFKTINLRLRLCHSLEQFKPMQTLKFSFWRM
jgi:hypothetical protein